MSEGIGRFRRCAAATGELPALRTHFAYRSSIAFLGHRPISITTATGRIRGRKNAHRTTVPVNWRAPKVDDVDR